MGVYTDEDRVYTTLYSFAQKALGDFEAMMTAHKLATFLADKEYCLEDFKAMTPSDIQSYLDQESDLDNTPLLAELLHAAAN